MSVQIQGFTLQKAESQTLVVQDEEALAASAAKVLVESFQAILAQKPRLNFIPSSGRTPVKTYKILAKYYQNALDWSRVTAVQMDEYWVTGLDPALYFNTFLKENVVQPLRMGGFMSMHKPDGMGLHAPAEYADGLHRLGPIDFALHGIGRNGHIGFNEPGSSANSVTRIVNLAAETRDDNFPGYAENQKPEFGITMGLSELRAVEHTLLIASGQHKASAINGLLTRRLVSETPASILWDSRDFGLIIDKDAAAFTVLREAAA